MTSAQGMSRYPRVCRNGHTITGPHKEHRGSHRQCKQCRLESQRRANERYDWPERYDWHAWGTPAAQGASSPLGFGRRMRKYLSYNNLSLRALEEEARAKYGDDWLKTVYADFDADLEAKSVT